MTFDERMDKLAERHQALTESVELLAHQSAENNRQLAGLIAASKLDGEHIRALARIAEIHEQRLTAIEDKHAPE